MAISTPIAIGTAAYAALLLIGSIGMRNRRRWGRLLQYPLAGANLFAFPIGTAIAVYSIMRVTNRDTQSLFTDEYTDVLWVTADDNEPGVSRFIEFLGAVFLFAAAGEGALAMLGR